jgi:hypothetical protein
MIASNIIKLVPTSNGAFEWRLGDRVVARVFSMDGRSWSVSWHHHTSSQQRLADQFPSPRDACLAAEKYWPEDGFLGWVESIEGGFFRRLGHTRKCVRRTAQAYYAVRGDGKVLGLSGQTIWFASAVDAMAAIEHDHYTSVDADPYRDNRQRLVWLRITGRRAA